MPPLGPTLGNPDTLDDVVNRLTRAVDDWQALPVNEQALLFTSIGVAGLTLLVRAGRLPASVLTLAPATGPVTGTPIRPPGTGFAGRPSDKEAAGGGSGGETESVDGSGDGPADGEPTTPDDGAATVLTPSPATSSASDQTAPDQATPDQATPDAVTPGDAAAAPGSPDSTRPDGASSEQPDRASGPPGPAGLSELLGARHAAGTAAGPPASGGALPEVPSLASLLATPPSDTLATAPSGAPANAVALPSLTEHLRLNAGSEPAATGGAESAGGAGSAVQTAPVLPPLSTALGGQRPIGAEAAPARAVQEDRVRGAAKALDDLRRSREKGCEK